MWSAGVIIASNDCLSTTACFLIDLSGAYVETKTHTEYQVQNCALEDEPTAKRINECNLRKIIE
jgi:hypothetical protein